MGKQPERHQANDPACPHCDGPIEPIKTLGYCPACRVWIRQCPVCQNLFTTREPRATVCSEECRQRAIDRDELLKARP
jgi:hypothetical protein